MTIQKLVSTILFFAVWTTLTACGHYYKVTDPGSGKVYYTQRIDNVQGGAVKFKNDMTHDSMTIQNSAVHEISKTDYKAGLVSQAKPETPPQVKTGAQPAR